jgi:Rieske 2Fe-2S family protein
MNTVVPLVKTGETFSSNATTLPRRFFVSPELFAEEQEKIFAHQWILVGRTQDLAAPGDFFLAEISGESIIIARDKGGEIRGFYNVCRHRGSRLCEERTGHLSAIQCPYHAWTYSLDGRLIGAPDMDVSFDKTAYSLASVNLGVWEGFIFINLAASPISLEKWFAPLVGKFAEWNLPELRRANRIDYDINANWKLMFQNYSECYHCSGVHPELTKLSPSDSAENDLCQGPFLGGFMTVDAGRSLTKSGNACAMPIADRGSNRVFYYSIFPNMLLSLHPDYVMLHTLRPQSPGRTSISCEWFFTPKAFEREDFNPNDAVEFWDMVNRQDWHVCELSQQGISSRAYQSGPYSPRESIPAAWDREYLRHMGG